MHFKWIDYSPDNAAVVESWLDDTAKRNTGCDDGWADVVDYWMHEPDSIPGENFWCKVILDNGKPFASVAVGLWDGVFTVSEIVVNPEKRGQGYGSAALKELLTNGRTILGKDIETAKAVIYPDNIASQKAFERAGFTFESAHPDGDAWYYIWKKA